MLPTKIHTQKIPKIISLSCLTDTFFWKDFMSYENITLRRMMLTNLSGTRSSFIVKNMKNHARKLCHDMTTLSIKVMTLCRKAGGTSSPTVALRKGCLHSAYNMSKLQKE